MSAILGQVAAAVGAIKMMSGLKSAWTRAHADGVRLWNVPGWLAYTGGRDPHKDMRCSDCRKVCETLVAITADVSVCRSCWAERRMVDAGLE
jgi:hypothetical protein